jgi:ketosteroid isomerase-like protein
LGTAYVHEIFRNLESGDGQGFFDHVADDVDWIVEGTHPLAGHYHSKASSSHLPLKSWQRFYRKARHCIWNMRSVVVTGRWSTLGSRGKSLKAFLLSVQIMDPE